MYAPSASPPSLAPKNNKSNMTIRCVQPHQTSHLWHCTTHTIAAATTRDLPRAALNYPHQNLGGHRHIEDRSHNNSRRTTKYRRRRPDLRYRTSKNDLSDANDPPPTGSRQWENEDRGRRAVVEVHTLLPELARAPLMSSVCADIQQVCDLLTI
jgi:hypothetical protein